MSEKRNIFEKAMSSPPMLVANLYDVAAVFAELRSDAMRNNESAKVVMESLHDTMTYIRVALQDILVHDHSVPCELGLRPIDTVRNTIFMFDDEVMSSLFSDSAKSPRDSLDVARLTRYQEVILESHRMRIIIGDIVNTYKLRCDADQAICLFQLAESLGVGYRAMK